VIFLAIKKRVEELERQVGKPGVYTVWRGQDNKYSGDHFEGRIDESKFNVWIGTLPQNAKINILEFVVETKDLPTGQGEVSIELKRQQRRGGRK
jgi:hypothetical protein